MNLKTLKDTPPWEWPRDAGKRFQKVLIDPHSKDSERLLAADLAGDVIAMNDELAECLLSIIRNSGEPDRLRARAATSLGPVLELADMDEFEEPDAVPITERTFRNIQESLQMAYLDESIPKIVRRRILEATVRAPEERHKPAIKAAYSSGDDDWMLTAVFCMRWVRGFDIPILEALKSANRDIHREAVKAAGNSEVDAAWPHIVALVKDSRTPKPVLLSAIEAIASIRPAEAGQVLGELMDSNDEDIADAAFEAIAMAKAASEDDDDDEDDEEVGKEWIN